MPTLISLFISLELPFIISPELFKKPIPPLRNPDASRVRTSSTLTSLALPINYKRENDFTE